MNENINKNNFIEVEVISEKIEKVTKVKKKLTREEKQGLIFSIISLVSFLIPIFGIILCTFGFYYSVNLINRDKKSKVGIISVILTSIGIILNIIGFFI